MKAGGSCRRVVQSGFAVGRDGRHEGQRSPDFPPDRGSAPEPRYEPVVTMYHGRLTAAP